MRSQQNSRSAVGRLLIAMAIVLLVSVTASAYTIVTRSGRRLQIPATFTINATTLTYEVAPRISVTLDLAVIDIPATERANNEPAGSFMRRKSVTVDQTGTAGTPQKSSARTITNRDLASYARARLENDQAYEQKAKELGLPSLEESRRRAERIQSAVDEIVAKRKQEEAENYWREREVELQAEMAVINAQMNALNYQSGPYWTGGFFPGGDAFGPFDSRFGFQRRFPFRFIQGSPCGFNPSPACLLEHPFPFDLNRGFFLRHRSVFVAPPANVGGRRFGAPGGGRGIIGPRR
jgi:hypothetical protein